MSERVVMSVAVEDIERAKQFYTGGLGFQIDQDHGYFVSFRQERRHRARRLRWQPPRNDAGLVDDDAGHRGVTLSCIVESAERVNELMTQAENAGATVVEPAHTAAWGGYIGYFTDPFGKRWKVVADVSG